MKEKITTICLILITLAILISAGFYWWTKHQEITRQALVEECFKWCLVQDWEAGMWGGYYMTSPEQEQLCIARCRLDPHHHLLPKPEPLDPMYFDVTPAPRHFRIRP